jgi:endonuclease/exonuclease/phosphatase family metal-dependent hydrolase
MKHSIRIFCYAALAGAMAACTQVEPQEPVVSEGEFSYIFRLSPDESKTSFESSHVAWQNGDQVASYASTSKNKYTDVVVNGSDVTITIRSSVALSAGDMVYTYAPYSKDNNEAEASAVTLEIPRNQVSGSADAMPMVSLPFELTSDVPKYTDTEVGTLQFMNLGSVIKLNIYKSSGFAAGEKIENVTFQAGKPCAGSFTYDLTTADVDHPAAISGYADTDVVVSADGAHPVTVGSSAENGGVFYIVVAPGTYGGTYVIRTSTGDYTYVSGSTREYKRAGLKPLNLDLSSANWTPHTGYDNSIDSPREFSEFLAGTSSSDTGSYTISADLDMTGYTITSASGFGGTLDGNDHVISNISSSVPLFAQISGSVSNLTLDETCVFTPAQTVTEFGALAALDNGGTYTNVHNAASITITATGDIENNIALGGLVGASDNASGSTFTSCSNSGAVTIDATEYTHWAVAMAGIVGWTRKSTFDYCTNSGPISLYAQYGDGYSHQWSFISSETSDTDGNISVAGICGRALDHEKTTDIKSSYNHCDNLAGGAITLRHTHMDALQKIDKTGCLNVAGICGQSNGSMESCVNYAPITAIAICPENNDYWERRNCLLKVGGIAGLTWEGIAINSCSNRGAINVNYDGSWYKTVRNMSAVGGIIGKQGYGLSNAKVTFSTNRGPITVTGNSHIAVGGITGSSGSMRGNRVYNTAPINVRCKEGYVGGLLGYADGSSQYQFIRTSYCEADITAEDTWDTNRYKVCVGGLIGYFATGATGSYPSLVPYSTDSQRCHYTGNVVSTGQMKVGMVIGWITNNNAKVFGTSDTPIQVTGTIHRWGYDSDNAMDEPLTIHAGNVEEYAIGAIKEGTVTMYVESPTPAPIPPVNLKLMSFNIKSSSDWGDRKGGIVSMIKGESPDIIGIQEVNELDSWDLYTEGGGKQPWNYLKDNLSDYSSYRPSTKTNAILYKSSVVELSNTGFFYLGNDPSASGSSNSWDDYERTVLYGIIRDKATGRYFFYVNTHFPLNQTGQTNSAALLESQIKSLNSNDYPVIMAGDFNCVIGNSCWDSIKTWMNNTRYSAAEVYSIENRDLYTFNAYGDSSKARNKVDHIWVSKSITVNYYITLTQEIRKYGSESYLSDHYPIIATIS